MPQNLCSGGDSLWEIMQEYYIKTASNIYFGCLLESPHCDSNEYPKHMFFEEIRKKKVFHTIILSIKDSLQQQIYFNSSIFGNKCCRCNKGSLQLSAFSVNWFWYFSVIYYTFVWYANPSLIFHNNPVIDKSFYNFRNGPYP